MRPYPRIYRDKVTILKKGTTLITSEMVYSRYDGTNKFRTFTAFLTKVGFSYIYSASIADYTSIYHHYVRDNSIGLKLISLVDLTKQLGYSVKL